MSMVQMNQEFYEKNFGGTPMTRAKISGLRRNTLIASVVKNDPRIFAELNTLANDPDAVIVDTAKQVPDYLKFAQTTQTSL
jgi:epoxyqueuosine reductase QueG